MRLLCLAAVACLSLIGSACATTTLPPAVTDTPVVSTRNTLLDERALYAAEGAYNVASSAYIAADRRGQLPADLKERSRAFLIRSFDALLLARRAYAAGDAETFTQQAAQVVALATEARAALQPQ